MGSEDVWGRIREWCRRSVGMSRRRCCETSGEPVGPDQGAVLMFLSVGCPRSGTL